MKGGQGKIEDTTKVIHQENQEDEMEDEADIDNENDDDEMEIETREMKSHYFTNHVHVGAGLSSLQVFFYNKIFVFLIFRLKLSTRKVLTSAYRHLFKLFYLLDNFLAPCQLPSLKSLKKVYPALFFTRIKDFYHFSR